MNALESKCITTLRMLSVDAIEKANSGHPGLPLGCASLAYTIWTHFLNHNPQNPKWFNRDRFILSAGHGSALLYALLHLYGYDLSLDDIKKFRQWGSKTPGHPEYGETPGVEATTGPLGQGFAMGIGMAITERYLGECYNKEDCTVIDHHVYGIVSDGDLMEGVTAEAASLAGHLNLGKIIYLYDDNKISIDGSTDITFSENVGKRFESYNWQVIRVADGNDCDAISQAIEKGKKEQTKPTLVIVRTNIGFGSPKQDTPGAHGSPLGEEALKATKEKFSWPLSPSFYIPEDVKIEMQKNNGHEKEEAWQKTMEEYNNKYPKLAKQLENSINDVFPDEWDKELVNLFDGVSDIATRSASGQVMNKIAEKIPGFFGGSADLAASNKTDIKFSGNFGEEQGGRNLRFGIREHAMASIVNGMTLHKGVIPFGATFLVFSDYMRPAIRLAALMKISSIFVFTHDSIALGEDGPTHQPVEHLMSLRLIPNLVVMRPADAIETTEMWKEAVTSSLPVAMSFTRQNLPVMQEHKQTIIKGARKGAYVLSEANDAVEVIIVATGSEVSLAMEAKIKLKGISVRIVSMPSWELFEQQNEEYKEQVLPINIPKVAVEAGSSLGWFKYVGNTGKVIALDRFGTSAPWEIAYDKLGFNVQNIIDAVKEVTKNV